MYQGRYNGGKEYHPPDLDRVLARAWGQRVEKIVVTAGSLAEAREALHFVERDERRRMQLEEVMAALGYEPVAFADWERAVKAARAEPTRFDAAVMDVFSSGSVPAHLVTRETFARLREIVDGPIYVNLLDSPDGPLVRGVNAILSELYPHIVSDQGEVGARGRTNILFAASGQPLGPLDRQVEGYGPTHVSDARAFTDDRGWIGHR